MLSKQVIVVTGGAGLIGQEFVRAIIGQNGTAIIADIDEGLGCQVREALSKELSTDQINFIKLDITSIDSIQACLGFLKKTYGRIDALVNNAYPRNKNYGRPFFEVEFNDFVQNVGMNLGGYFLTSQQFSTFFKQQGCGNIVNIGSIYGVIPPRFEIYEGTNITTPVEYAAIKSALIHFTKYLAKYLKGMNIRVNTLSPGGILDRQDERFVQAYNSKCLKKGMLNPCDLKGALVFLLSDMSRFVNGQNIVVDDGFTL